MAGSKVLVAYGTRYGSARVVAEDVKEYLEKLGNDVVVVNLRKQKMPGNLPEYDLIVAGSSVAMFSWIPVVKRFLRKCSRTKVPTAVYISCGTDIDDPGKARSRFLDKVLDRIGISPVLSETIGPVLDFRPGSGIPEKLKKRIKSIIKELARDRYQEDGLMDLRDPERFDTFLRNLAGLLGGPLNG